MDKRMSEVCKRRLADIRHLYSTIDISAYNPYPIDWLPIFTPIEDYMWGAIRGQGGLPFWPQLPIGKYFADFADPIKKIVLECDGAEFHKDKDRDRRRDEYMASKGWRVFRVSGADCRRVLPSPGEVYEEYRGQRIDEKQAIAAIRDWYLNTCDGLIAAIASGYYEKEQCTPFTCGGLIDTDLNCEVLSKRSSQ